MGCCNNKPISHGEYNIKTLDNPKSQFINSKENLDQVTKIQAHIRGYKVRKNLNQDENIHCPKPNIAVLIDDSLIPKNQITLEILDKVEEIIYEKKRDYENYPKLGKKNKTEKKI